MDAITIGNNGTHLTINQNVLQSTQFLIECALIIYTRLILNCLECM